ALAATVDPQSTSFQRSEAWRIATQKGQLRWRQQWVPYEAISDNLKRAVIASEDGSFTNHDGVDWEAIEKAWQRNAQAEERAARQKPRDAARSQPAPKDRRRIHHHAAARQEPAAVRRAHAAAQGPGVRAGVRAGKDALQGAHP